MSQKILIIIITINVKCQSTYGIWNNSSGSTSLSTNCTRQW